MLSKVAWVETKLMPVAPTAKDKLTLPPWFLASKVETLLVWTLRAETAKPEEAEVVSGVKVTLRLSPIAPTFRLSAFRRTVLPLVLPWAVAEIALSLSVTLPVTVSPVAPTVDEMPADCVSAKVVTVSLFCEFNSTAEAVMLPTLPVCPALIRLPARLLVAAALKLLPLCVRLPVLLSVSRLDVMVVVPNEPVNVLPLLR